jgi:hypothetical protein
LNLSVELVAFLVREEDDLVLEALEVGSQLINLGVVVLDCALAISRHVWLGVIEWCITRVTTLNSENIVGLLELSVDVLWDAFASEIGVEGGKQGVLDGSGSFKGLVEAVNGCEVLCTTSGIEDTLDICLKCKCVACFSS